MPRRVPVRSFILNTFHVSFFISNSVTHLLRSIKCLNFEAPIKSAKAVSFYLLDMIILLSKDVS